MDGIAIGDTHSGIITYANQSWLTMTGYSFTDIGFINFQKLIAGDDRERVIHDLRENRFQRLSDLAIKKKDGSVFWAEVSAFSYREGEHDVKVGVFHDLTERKRWEKTIIDSEARIRAILNSVPDIYFRISRNGTFLDVHARETSDLLATREQIIGASIDDILSPDLAALTWHHMDITFATNALQTYEYTITKNGVSAYYEARMVMIDETEVVSIIRNKTDRKKTELALEESEDRFRRIFADSAIGMVLCDLTGKFLRVNRQFAQITGYTEQELLGMSFPAITHPDDLEIDMKNVIMLIEGKSQSYEIEKRYLHKNGKTVWVLLTVSILKNQQGEPAFFAGQVQNITEKKQHEEELKQAVNIAREASRAKSEFLANMSHEIRTPMNGVLGMLNLLSGTELCDDQRRIARMAKISAEGLLTIINDILDFSKIEAGKLSLAPASFNLKELIRSVHEMMKFSAEEKHIGFFLEDELPLNLLFYGDDARIRQIMINLIGNAIKFTDRGLVTLSVTLQNPGDPQSPVMIAISDTGIGIPEERIESIFHSFEQADTSITRKFGGTGLGLSITRQLTSMMNGTLTVTSRIGVGSIFTVTLPLERMVTGAVASEDASPLDDVGISLPIVIVLDDEFMVTELAQFRATFTSLYLRKPGSIDEARAILCKASSKGVPVSLVIIPDSHDRDFIKGLMDLCAASSQENRTRFIFKAEKGYRGQTEWAKNLGFHGYIAAPFSPSALFDMVTHVLGARDDIFRERIITSHWIASLKNDISEPTHETSRPFLIVEDNRVNQVVAQRLLKKMGYESDLAENGREAITMVSTGSYAIVFMDIQMPGMDGYQATKEIRNLPGLQRDTVIIAMTAGAMDEDRELTREAGMNDHITKPINPQELSEIIDRWFRKKN